MLKDKRCAAAAQDDDVATGEAPLVASQRLTVHQRSMAASVIANEINLRGLLDDSVLSRDPSIRQPQMRGSTAADHEGEDAQFDDLRDLCLKNEVRCGQRAELTCGRHAGGVGCAMRRRIISPVLTSVAMQG